MYCTYVVCVRMLCPPPTHNHHHNYPHFDTSHSPQGSYNNHETVWACRYGVPEKQESDWDWVLGLLGRGVPRCSRYIYMLNMTWSNMPHLPNGQDLNIYILYIYFERVYTLGIYICVYIAEYVLWPCTFFKLLTFVIGRGEREGGVALHRLPRFFPCAYVSRYLVRKKWWWLLRLFLPSYVVIY